MTTLDALYLAEPPGVIDTLKSLPDPADRVMIIGQNPDLESLLQHFTGAVESLPTSSIAYLELPIMR